MFVWRWTFDCAKDHHSVRHTPALGFDITAHFSYTATTIESNPILTQSSEWAQQTWLWPVTNLRVGLVRNGRFLIVVSVAARVAGPAVGGRGTQGLHRSRCLGQVNVHGKEVDGAIWQHTHTLLYNSESEYPLPPFPQMVHTGSGRQHSWTFWQRIPGCQSPSSLGQSERRNTFSEQKNMHSGRHVSSQAKT